MNEHNKGSILIFTMWVLTILALFSVAVGFSVRTRLDMLRRLENREDLRLIADSGVNQALHLLYQNNSGVHALSDSWSVNPEMLKEKSIERGMFSVFYQAEGLTYYGVVDEESKININSTKSSLTLKRLFREGANLTDTDAEIIALSLLDWRDGDENAYDNGAESKFYMSARPSYRSKNRDLNSPEELLFVRGMTPEIYQKMEPYLTIWSTGKINLNTASSVVLKSMGMSDLLAQKLLTFRAGNDQIPRTADDRIFHGFDTALEDLNSVVQLDDNERQSFTDFIESGVFSVRSEYFKIQVRAELKNQTNSLMVSCIAKITGEIEWWHEEFRASEKVIE